MELDNLHSQLEQIDGEIGSLFSRRMALCAEIARERAAGGAYVPDITGERAARVRFRERAGEELEGYAGVLYATLAEVGRSYQAAVLTTGRSEQCARIAAALESTPCLFPEKANVACQGVEGAYSQIAVEKLFREPSIAYVSSFEAVFSAIDSGLCRYGVLPLENSTAGSVNRIYDLMMKYRFSIIRSVRIKIDHNLLAKPGAKLADIREIFSHEQALSQSAEFLRSHPEIKATTVENTAVAAKLVAESDRSDVAALSSRSCAELYGLHILADAVQDAGNNHTRFICIGKDLEIYPGADRTSIMLTTPHRPGSLYRIMARINALGINLTKLESRPLPDRDFEFMFYFDLDTPIYSPKLIQLMNDLETLCETFRYLGSYSEIM